MASKNKLLKLSHDHLEPDETILAHVYGAYETKRFGSASVRNGIFLATTQRLLFYAKKMMGYEIESLPYENISSFEQGKNMMGHNFKFFASGNEASVKWIKDPKPEVDNFVATVKGRMKGGKPAAEPPAPAAPDPVDELRRYAQLRDEGIITPEDFEAKKRQLLG